MQRKRYLLLTVSTTDYDVIKRFHNIIGLGKLYGPYHRGNNWKPIYRWCTTSHIDALMAISVIYKYLSERRLDRLNECLTQITETRYGVSGR